MFSSEEFTLHVLLSRRAAAPGGHMQSVLETQSETQRLACLDARQFQQASAFSAMQILTDVHVFGLCGIPVAVGREAFMTETKKAPLKAPFQVLTVSSWALGNQAVA